MLFSRRFIKKHHMLVDLELICPVLSKNRLPRVLYYGISIFAVLLYELKISSKGPIQFPV